MKLQSVEGFLLAYSFIKQDIETYKSDDKFIQLVTIYNMLDKIMADFAKRVNLRKILNRIFKKFTPLANEAPEIETIVFALHFIIKNPNIKKYPYLKKLALEENRKYLFSQIEEEKKSKEIVNKFYQIKDKK